MIASLTGTVAALNLDSLIIDVNSVGYRVNITGESAAKIHLNQHLTLYTELIVREDSHTLYGFLSQTEVDFFQVLIAASGIGPRTALATLSVLTPAEFAKAVLAEDIKTITKVPGIGIKGAKRLALDLKEKMASFAYLEAPEVVEDSQQVLNTDSLEVVRGLKGLGWNEKLAIEAVEAAIKYAADSHTEPSQANLLRLALRELGGR